MLSYQHTYHVGNFADVIKHFVLSRLLNYLTIKPKPLSYLETHAGRGLYSLHSQEALKTQEAETGIQLVWENKTSLPSVLMPNIQTISAINDTPRLQYYPGSPYFALHGLREQDRLYFCELHPQEYAALRTLRYPKRRFHCYHGNGMSQLASLLPPPERRGLIFMDPSYEIKAEYEELPRQIHKAYQRFSTGTFCLWYPILAAQSHLRLLDGLSKIASKNTLRIEFFCSQSQPGMYGCGLWILNPPYLLAQECHEGLGALQKILNPETSHFLIERPIE